MNKNVIIGICISLVIFIGGVVVVTMVLKQKQAASLSQIQDEGRIAPSEKTKDINPSEIKTTDTMEKPKKQWDKQPAMSIDKAKTYIATLHTSEGDISIALNAKQTPITVNNFVFLAKNGFYANTTFHRVIKDFMIQGGDPVGNGTGGPGYSFNDEPFSGEYTRGTVAMANAGANTNGSQFFIMHQDRPLPKSYVIFGSITKGLDVLDTIAQTEVAVSDSGEPSKPIKSIILTSVDISEK